MTTEHKLLERFEKIIQQKKATHLHLSQQIINPSSWRNPQMQRVMLSSTSSSLPTVAMGALGDSSSTGAGELTTSFGGGGVGDRGGGGDIGGGAP
jgi:hypothetical protein